MLSMWAPTEQLLAPHQRSATQVFCRRNALSPEGIELHLWSSHPNAMHNDEVEVTLFDFVYTVTLQNVLIVFVIECHLMDPALERLRPAPARGIQPPGTLTS